MKLRVAVVFLFLAGCLAGATTVVFDPTNPGVGPFPSDALTVPDPAQKTGLRVKLPFPDCAAQPSTCLELGAVNQLDGFSLQPRIRVVFSAPVNVDTLRDGIWFVALDNLTQEEYGLNRPGDRIPINEVVYDPASNTAYAKPDNVLDQHRRYALVVTDAVRDAAGAPVAASTAYQACSTAPSNRLSYCAALGQAVAAASAGVAPQQVVAASVFTTMSATAWLEKARAQLRGTSAAARIVSPKGGYRVADYAALVWHRQVGVNPSRFDDFTIPLDPALLGGVGRVAFGSYQSPSFLNAGQTIDAAPTGLDVPLPAASSEIAFTVYLPDSTRPAGGFPVAIFGHGLGDSRLGGPTAVAATLAQAGFATIAISAVGHGYGPESAYILVDKAGNRVVAPGPGRGVDLNGDGAIDATEGCIIPAAGAVLRDCLRQTALDLAQLVRVIQAGVDADGDGTVDLDARRIYYGGQSLGGLYGTLFNAIEPTVRAATLNSGGGSVVDLARWSPGYRSLVTGLLALRQPPALNLPGGYNEDYVLRYQDVKVPGVPGAVDIQNLLELYDWMGMSGDPVAYAPHLYSSTLPGLGIKPVLFQFARGDRTVPNPAETRLVRAANMRWATWLYRHDLARAALPSLPANPHAYLVFFLDPDTDITSLDLRLAAISISAQVQMAGFFQADGATIPDANNFALRLLFGGDLFEVPSFLPEDLGL